jgi:hypothetical protein
LEADTRHPQAKITPSSKKFNELFTARSVSGSPVGRRRFSTQFNPIAFRR